MTLPLNLAYFPDIPKPALLPSLLASSGLHSNLFSTPGTTPSLMHATPYPRSDMRRISLFLFAAVAGPIGLMPSTAAGQARAEQTVPLELVRLLLSGAPLEPDARPDILVGRLPQSVTQAVVLPRDARPVGSAVFRDISRSIVALPQAPEDALVDMEQRLLQGGWTGAPREPQGGFESSAMYQPGLTLCRGDSDAIVLRASRRESQGSYVHILHMVDRSQSPCRSPAARRHVIDPPIPLLLAPPGVRVRGSGMGGSPDHADAHAQLTTTMTPASLIVHYGAQLREHGWTPAVSSSSEETALQTWQFTDDQGERWFGVLLATSIPELDAREVHLRVTRIAAVR